MTTKRLIFIASYLVLSFTLFLFITLPPPTAPPPEIVTEIAPAPILHSLTLSVINGESKILVDGNSQEAGTPFQVEQGKHAVTLRREGYDDQSLSLDVTSSMSLSLRHQKRSGPWVNVGVFPTGKEPKQVSFTPDGGYLMVTLLNDTGFDVYDLLDMNNPLRVSPPMGEKKGFVESLMCTEKNTFWVSQMTTDRVYEYTLPSEASPLPLLVRSFPARGTWTKVIAHDRQYRWLAVANWVSSSVTILDYGTGALITNITGLSVPRGLAFSPDDKYLFIASYEGNALFKYSTDDWKEEGRFKSANSSLRHVVVSKDGSTLWVSDMAKRSVYELNTVTLTLTHTFTVNSHPNTIAVSPDESRLFVSCRGPNNPESYLLRSPEDGTVHIFNLATREEEAVLQGGNQPTGLSVSPDGTLLAFTNFLDDTLELYERQDYEY